MILALGTALAIPAGAQTPPPAADPAWAALHAALAQRVETLDCAEGEGAACTAMRPTLPARTSGCLDTLVASGRYRVADADPVDGAIVRVKAQVADAAGAPRQYPLDLLVTLPASGPACMPTGVAGRPGIALLRDRDADLGRTALSAAEFRRVRAVLDIERGKQATGVQPARAAHRPIEPRGVLGGMFGTFATRPVLGETQGIVDRLFDALFGSSSNSAIRLSIQARIKSTVFVRDRSYGVTNLTLRVPVAALRHVAIDRGGRRATLAACRRRVDEEGWALDC